MSDIEYVCYVFVNQELGMGCGKKCGQVGHGIGAIYRGIEYKSTYLKDCFEKWEQSGTKKIIMKAKDKAELEEISNNNPSELVYDAGRTQIPAGSLTVVALYPKVHIKGEFKNKLL